MKLQLSKEKNKTKQKTKKPKSTPISIRAPRCSLCFPPVAVVGSWARGFYVRRVLMAAFLFVCLLCFVVVVVVVVVVCFLFFGLKLA